jgi:hypothetical protein
VTPYIAICIFCVLQYTQIKFHRAMITFQSLSSVLACSLFSSSALFIKLNIINFISLSITFPWLFVFSRNTDNNIPGSRWYRGIQLNQMVLYLDLSFLVLVLPSEFRWFPRLSFEFFRLITGLKLTVSQNFGFQNLIFEFLGRFIWYDEWLRYFYVLAIK